MAGQTSPDLKGVAPHASADADTDAGPSLHLDVRLAVGDLRLEVADQIPLHGITAIFGQSGSGKTTLLRIISGLERRAEGRVAFDGDVWQDGPGAASRPPHLRTVGTVFQDARLFHHLDVRGNLDFALRRRRRQLPQLTLDSVVAALDLEDLLARQPSTLSGGERQRVALARALLTAPRLILMDEPLASIDGRRKREILPYIERLPRDFGLPVVYVTHAIDEVAAMADRIVLLSQGRRVASGPVVDILARLDLFPLTGRFEAGAVIAAVVVGHDRGDHLTEVTFDGGHLAIPLIDAAIGSSVRVRLRARDVILSTGGDSAAGNLSANNALGGVISDMRADAGTFVDVQVTCGGTQIISRVTHRSIRRLGLAVGTPVQIIVKSITIDGHAGRSAAPPAET